MRAAQETARMLTPSEAEEQIALHLPRFPVESLPVGYCAGAVLREDVHAERDHPPYDRVMLDGIALPSAALAAGQREFLIQATQAAGAPPVKLASQRHCVQVMTGAVLPPGCDAVIGVEQIDVHEGRAVVHPGVTVEAGHAVHRRASDLPRGSLLLRAGMRLRAPDVSTAAGAGMARLSVSQQPSFMVVSTGNELVEPGEPVLDWQVRRSNAYGVAAALRQRGFQRVADDHLPDDARILQDRLRNHLTTHEVLVLSGGVSMGKFDLVPQALAACGVRQVFHKVAQRPGKPLWFGVTDDGRAVFALPGNPVSTLVCLVRYVFPAIDRAMGCTPAPPGEPIALGQDVRWDPKLTGFLPVTVDVDAQGRASALPVHFNTSGDFAALSGTPGFVELPPGPTICPQGFVTRLFRW